MIIKSLKLKNFRRFPNLELDLPENLIGIIGRNGSGKTTLLEAIGWVLYGNRPELVRTSKNEIRSQFADDKDICSVEVIFEIGGLEYRVLRELRGKNAVVEAAVYRVGDETPEAVQDSGVNDFIENLLGLDYKSFFASVFARQRDLAALSEMRPEERRQAINRLINIDRIDAARESIRRDRKEKQAYIQGRESHIKDIGILQQTLGTQQAQLNLIQTQSKDKEKEIRDLEKMRRQQQTELEKANETRDRFFDLQREIEKLQERRLNKLHEHERTVGEIEKLEQAKTEYEKLQPQIEAWQEMKQEKDEWDRRELLFRDRQNQQALRERLAEELRQDESTIQGWEEQAAGIDKEKASLDGVEEKIETLTETCDALRDRQSRLQGEITSFRSKMDDIDAHRKTVEDLGEESPCPVCTRPLKEHYGVVIERFSDDSQKLLNSLALTEKELRATTDSLAEASDTLKKRQKDQQQWIRLTSRQMEILSNLKSVRSALDRKKTEIREIDTHLKELGTVAYSEEEHRDIRIKFEELSVKRDQALLLQSQTGRLPDIKTLLKNLDTAIKETNDDIDRTCQYQNKLGYNEKDFIAQKSAVETSSQQLEMANEKLSEIRKNLALGEREIKQLEEQIAEQETIRREIESLKEEIAYLQLLDDHFGSFRLELAGRMRPLIAGRASELLALLTNSRYSILELDEDYNIHIYDGTERFSIRRFSGGEQDLANLCLRIAISQVVAERSGKNPLNFIALDEIFGSQDQERKELILSALNRLSARFRQIFVITHIEDVKDVMPVLIEVNSVDPQQSTAILT